MDFWPRPTTDREEPEEPELVWPNPKASTLENRAKMVPEEGVEDSQGPSIQLHSRTSGDEAPPRPSETPRYPVWVAIPFELSWMGNMASQCSCSPSHPRDSGRYATR